VVLQAFIDESVTPTSTFVMAGYIATAEAWAQFSREWEALLPLTMRSSSSAKRRFKMNEMAQYMDRVPAFYHVIERHALFSLSCKIDVDNRERAID
jgi:hypothetical protein